MGECGCGSALEDEGWVIGCMKMVIELKREFWSSKELFDVVP